MSLQFDRAEPREPAAAEGLTCVGCQAAIGETYHTLNGKIVCADCREAFRAGWSGGFHAGPFFRALLFGIGAAAAGGGVYYLSMRLMKGVQWSLFSILVGYLVGIAVRKGADRRGGPPFQAAAVLLTYAGIVSAYVPVLLEGESVSPGSLARAFVQACAHPWQAEGVNLVLMGFIIGFALYEAAWLTRRVPLVFQGPFQARPRAAGSEGPPVA